MGLRRSLIFATPDFRSILVDGCSMRQQSLLLFKNRDVIDRLTLGVESFACERHDSPIS